MISSNPNLTFLLKFIFVSCDFKIKFRDDDLHSSTCTVVLRSMQFNLYYRVLSS